MIEFIKGNILESNCKYICHQCNCVSKTSAGLASQIFTEFPWADIYKNRENNSTPGTIIIKGNGLDKRFVINILGQIYPGKPYPGNKDNKESRERYFTFCLKKILKIKDLGSLAFPDHIGCGLAGGDWKKYLFFIKSMDNFLSKNKNEIKINIVRFS
ncbi:MAG: macro domain-containing protein [Bacillota bacterium]